MSVRIGSNIASLKAQRRLSEHTSALAKTLERLSSGQRINRAADDAAGLAISSSLTADVRVTNQAVRNLNDGISYSTIASGALRELKNVLLRQRELATQSSSGTCTDKQRQALDSEMKQLSEEYRRILDTTSFNGLCVFARTNGRLALQAGYGTEGVLFGAGSTAESDSQYWAQRINVAANGAQSGAEAYSTLGVRSMSADGRFAVFYSVTNDLVEGSSGGQSKIFLKDMFTGEVQLISRKTDGSMPDGSSWDPSISADGRFVTFRSTSTQLVTGDANSGGNSADIFLYNVENRSMSLVSVTTSGGFTNQTCTVPRISPDGRFVAFQSTGSGLSAEDTTGITDDIFVRDLLTGLTHVASNSTTNGAPNSTVVLTSVDNSGRVLFQSGATNLVANDNNAKTDVFMHDIFSNTTTRVSVDLNGGDADGNSGGGFISRNGRYLAFSSWASDIDTSGATGTLNNVYVKDLLTGTVKRISFDYSGGNPDNHVGVWSISDDGRYVLLSSMATDLVEDDTNGKTDIFVADTITGETRRVNRTPLDGQSTSESTTTPFISGDGRYITFKSAATDLVGGDTNAVADLFQISNPLIDWFTVSDSRWLSVQNRSDALVSQGKIDGYLEELNGYEGQIGGVLSRLEVAARNLSSMSENFAAADSRIRDADIAAESAALTKSQILQQAASSILAQANQSPALALRLLQG